MAYGNGSVFVQKKHSHRLAHDIASADYNTFPAADVNAAFVDKLHNSRGGTGNKIKITNHNFADICRVKRVNIFVGRNAVDYSFIVKVLGQWKLNQYSVNFIIVV